MLKSAVIKLSGEALAGDGVNQTGKNFDDTVIDDITRQIKIALTAGTQIALVVGGGNFWRGLSARPDMDRVKADQMGMLATVMNALYLAEAFKRQGVNAVVMTPLVIGNITTVFTKDAALSLMAQQTVVINAAGLGHPFFSTDTITALRAAELQADMVLYAKNIDGVYDGDPKKVTTARKYKTLSYRTAIANQLNAADLTALQMAAEAGIPSLVFGLNEPDSIIRACAVPYPLHPDDLDFSVCNGTLLDTQVKEVFYHYVNTIEAL